MNFVDWKGFAILFLTIFLSFSRKYVINAQCVSKEISQELKQYGETYTCYKHSNQYFLIYCHENQKEQKIIARCISGCSKNNMEDPFCFGYDSNNLYMYWNHYLRYENPDPDNASDDTIFKHDD